MPQSECHGLFSHWNWFTDSRCRPKDCNSYKPIWVTVFGPTFLVPLWEHLSLTTEWQIDWSFLFLNPDLWHCIISILATYIIVQKYDSFKTMETTLWKNLGGVWFVFSNNHFQFLNNILRISTHFFTYTYFHKYF